MSKCRISCPYVGVLDLNVTSFNSPLTGNMRSAQIKAARDHFPIKADQQQLQLNCVFRGWNEYRSMQEYVRNHQQRALQTVQTPEVTVWWPARNIDNWTGIITNMAAGDDRFNIAPKASITILLIDSLLSQKTFTSSFGEDFSKFFQTDIGDPTSGIRPPVVLPPPTKPVTQGEAAAQNPPPASRPGRTQGGSF